MKYLQGMCILFQAVVNEKIRVEKISMCFMEYVNIDVDFVFHYSFHSDFHYAEQASVNGSKRALSK